MKLSSSIFNILYL